MAIEKVNDRCWVPEPEHNEHEECEKDRDYNRDYDDCGPRRYRDDDDDKCRGEHEGDDDKCRPGYRPIPPDPYPLNPDPGYGRLPG